MPDHVILLVRMWIEVLTFLCHVIVSFCHSSREEMDWNFAVRIFLIDDVRSSAVWGRGCFADYFHIKSIQKDNRLSRFNNYCYIQQILVRFFWTSKEARRYSQCYPDISQSRRCSLWNQRIGQRDYCVFRCTVLRAVLHLDCSGRKLN